MFQEGRHVLRGGVERAIRARGEQQQLVRTARRSGGHRGSLLQHEVRVGAPHPEGAHRGAARHIRGRPGLKFLRSIEGRAGQIDERVGPLEMKQGRKLGPVQGQHGLDQASHARRRFQMAHVGLDGAEGAEVRVRRGQAVGAGQARHFDGIAERGPGAVGFHVANGAGRNAGFFQGHADDLGLALHAGRHKAGLLRPIVVDRPALDHGIHRVAIGLGIGQPLQHHQPAAGAKHRARGLGIEGPAMAVGGGNAALHIEVAALLREGDRDTSGQSHVARPGGQALAGLADGHQGARAGGLDGHAGPAQVQLIGHPGGHIVLVVADYGGIAAHLIGLHHLGHRGARGQDVVHQVGVHAGRGINPDGPRIARGIVARVLQGLPGALQENAVLRVRDLGIARAVAEEGGVEPLAFLQHAAGPYELERGIGRQLGRGRVQFVVAENGDGLAPFADAAPQLLHVVGPREAPGQAHYSNGIIRGRRSRRPGRTPGLRGLGAA